LDKINIFLLHMRNTTIKDFIQESLIEQIEKIGKDPATTYHAFALDSIAIEFLGKLLGKDSLYKEGNSKRDFKNAIEILFPTKYHPFSTFLYEELRCGMLHFFGPKAKVALGFNSNPNNLIHLTVTPSGKLVLLFEEFHNDFKKAVEKILKKKIKKLDEVFIQVGDYKDI
jgi:hypothetical protein